MSRFDKNYMSSDGSVDIDRLRYVRCSKVVFCLMNHIDLCHVALTVSTSSPNYRSSFKGEYLARVYFTLGVMALTAVVGATVATMYHLPYLLVVLGTIVSFGFFVFTSTESVTFGIATRELAVYAISFFSGASLEPLCSLADSIDPNLVMQAIIGSLIIFFACSYGALRATNEQMFMMRSLMSTLAIGFLGYGLASIFFPRLLGGVLMTAINMVFTLGAVMFHTRTIISQPVLHEHQHLMDALALFGRLIDIFSQVLRMLMDNKRDQERKEREKRRNQGSGLNFGSFTQRGRAW